MSRIIQVFDLECTRLKEKADILDDPDLADKSAWKGHNMMGQVLMEIRDYLAGLPEFEKEVSFWTFCLSRLKTGLLAYFVDKMSNLLKRIYLIKLSKLNGIENLSFDQNKKIFETYAF